MAEHNLLSGQDELKPVPVNTPVGESWAGQPWAWRAMYAYEQPASERVPMQIRQASRSVWTGESRWPLVLIGEAGSGKSCAALLTLHWHEGNGWYLPFAAWCSRLALAKHGELQTSAGFPLSERETWQEYERATLTVLDDIGLREKPTDHQYDALKRALDVREHLPSIYISNLTIEDLAKLFDDRVASRLLAGTVAYVEDDQREPQGAVVR